MFRTHTGEIVSGDRLTNALSSVADDWATLARAIRAEDAYASHVSEADKNQIMKRGLAHAEAIRSGEIGGFTIWQRVNTKLTGQCIALLPA